MMLGSALAAAKKAKEMQERIEEEERQRKLAGLTKPRKQGWFKGSGSTSTASKGSKSGSSVDSDGGSNSSKNDNDSHSRNSNPFTSSSESLKGTPPIVSDIDVPTTPGGTPTGFNKSNTDDVSVLSSINDSHTHGGHSVSSNRSSSSQNQVVDALISGMEDERMCDVTLIGRTGCKVRATKFVLACRSPALQEILYKDPSKQEIFVGNYCEDAITALKIFCHTGGIKGAALLKTKNADSARGLVELATMAKLYGFEVLYGEADSELYEMMHASPWLATAAYDSGGPEVPDVEEFLRVFIKGHCPDLLLETNAMKHLGKDRLLLLLDGLECSEKEMLKYLEKWVELKGATRENVSFLRATAAKKLDLQTLLSDPEMVPHVRGSGIFDRYMVESMINASPIVEEEEEEEDSSSDEDDYTASPQTPLTALDDASHASPSSSLDEKKKKKKKDKEKKEKKEKKDKKKKKSKKTARRSSTGELLTPVDETVEEA